MIPSSEQIAAWGEDMGDGWVRLPASSWPELLWCLRKAESLESSGSPTMITMESALSQRVDDLEREVAFLRQALLRALPKEPSPADGEERIRG